MGALNGANRGKEVVYYVVPFQRNESLCENMVQQEGE